MSIVRTRLARSEGREAAVGRIFSQLVAGYQAGRPAAVEGDRRARGQTYQRSSLVHGLIKVRANAVSQARLTVLKNGKEVGSNDLLGKIAARPNPQYVPARFGARVETDIWTHGEAILTRRGSERKVTRELWPMRIDRMESIPALDGSVSHWEQWLDGRKVDEIPVEKVIHIRTENPLHDYRGLSPIFVLDLEASLDDSAKLFLSELLRNGGIPAAVITSKETIDDKTAKQLSARWRELYGRRYGVRGGTGYGEAAVLGDGATVDKFGLDPNSMDLSNITRVSESRACAVIGVPALLASLTVGSEHSAAYGFLDDTQWAFWFNVIIPELLWLEQEWTAQVASEFGDEYSFRYDLSQVPALVGARTGAMQNAVMLFRNELISRRKALAMCGFPDMDNGEDIMASKLGLAAPPAPTGQGGTGAKTTRPKILLPEEAAA